MGQQDVISKTNGHSQDPLERVILVLCSDGSALAAWRTGSIRHGMTNRQLIADVCTSNLTNIYDPNKLSVIIIDTDGEDAARANVLVTKALQSPKTRILIRVEQHILGEQRTMKEFGHLHGVLSKEIPIEECLALSLAMLGMDHCDQDPVCLQAEQGLFGLSDTFSGDVSELAGR